MFIAKINKSSLVKVGRGNDKIKQIEAILKEIAHDSSEFRKRLSEVVELV